jgi:hypothetical protein
VVRMGSVVRIGLNHSYTQMEGVYPRGRHCTHAFGILPPKRSEFYQRASRGAEGDVRTTTDCERRAGPPAGVAQHG